MINPFRRRDYRWRKSRASNPNGACVEVGQRRLRRGWRKSRASRATACVEVASGTQVLVRDTKYAPRGEVSPVLAFTPQAWSEFTGGLKLPG